MNQAATRRDRKEPINQMLVRCINVGLAARTFNDILDDIEVSPQRERIAVEIWRKLVPSYAAVHMEVHDNRPQSIHDLNSRLLMSGLDPLDITPEKTIVAEDDSEAPHPPLDTPE